MTAPRGTWIAVVAALVAAALYVVHLKDALEAEKLERHNAEAAADTSHLVYHSATLRASERLAFQRTETLQLQGELGRALHRAGEQTEAIVRLHVALDSLANVVSTGQVTAGADSTLRNLSASLDTSGFHVSFRAVVPPPPAAALVHWNVRMDTIGIVAAIVRDRDGRAIIRAAVPADATVTVDSGNTVRASIGRGLSRTQKLARGGLLVLLGYALRELVLAFTKH